MVCVWPPNYPKHGLCRLQNASRWELHAPFSSEHEMQPTHTSDGERAMCTNCRLSLAGDCMHALTRSGQICSACICTNPASALIHHMPNPRIRLHCAMDAVVLHVQYAVHSGSCAFRPRLRLHWQHVDDYYRRFSCWLWGCFFHFYVSDLNRFQFLGKWWRLKSDLETFYAFIYFCCVFKCIWILMYWFLYLLPD